MSTITSDLEKTLNELDAESAGLLERLVRDALALVQRKAISTTGPVDAMGWPVGHFEKYAGCLKGDDWQPPADPPPESTPV